MEYKAVAKSDLFKSIVELARPQRDIKGLRSIVSFNFDDPIDEWLRENNVRCDTIVSGNQRERESSLPCYHVHGVLPFRKTQQLRGVGKETKKAKEIIGNFVFSEDEYHTEYSDPYRWSNMTMMSLLGISTGLFVGLSMEDPNLRRLLDVTHRQFPDRHHYAVLTRERPVAKIREPQARILHDLFEKVETESFLQIGVRVIWTDSYDEIPERLRQISNLDVMAVNYMA